MNKVVSKNNAEHYNWGINCDGWYLLKTENLSIIQEKVPPSQFEVKHYHKKSRQFFFILNGMATIDIDGIKYKVEKQKGIFVDAGVPHQLFNESNEDLEFLVISSPQSHGDRING